MATKVIGSQQFSLPILVPSISSYETPINISAAVSIQFALREPISLVSAFDYWHESDIFRRAVDAYSNAGVLLVDSGGYECQRLQRIEDYYDSDSKNKIRWNEELYYKTLGMMNFELAFSYDYKHGNDIKEYTSVLLTKIGEHVKMLGNRVIPVIHAVGSDRVTRLPIEELASICAKVSRAYNPTFVAVPERELGSGLLERAQAAKLIVQGLQDEGDTGLHILGCGNPLSSAVFSSVGVAMVDGLEWCRTFFCEPMWLSHFQHEEILPYAAEKVSNLGATQLLKGPTTYEDRVAIRNLLALQSFGIRLSSAIESRQLPGFLSEIYGHLPAKIVTELSE